MEATESIVAIEVTYREPITLALLTRACALCSITIEAVIYADRNFLENIHPPLEQAQEFLNLVLIDAPIIEGQTALESAAFLEVVMAHFFFLALEKKLRKVGDLLAGTLKSSSEAYPAAATGRATTF